jgi:hypothetical protein
MKIHGSGAGSTTLRSHITMWKETYESRLRETKVPYTSFEVVGEILKTESFVPLTGLIDSLFVTYNYQKIIEITKHTSDNLKFLRERRYEKNIKKKSDILSIHRLENINEIKVSFENLFDHTTKEIINA